MSGSHTGDQNDLPIALLSCQQDSHPFVSRRIYLDNTVKVGRSVARFKPEVGNAIFDCKVLSRSHALIWYKFGHFWLRDTNSSNGTFVNNTRVIKKPDEENADRELFSGDIIRFGVEVVEHKTTHGCIIACATLYHPNGVEAKPDVNEDDAKEEFTEMESKHAEKIFRLSHFVSEALYREQVLEGKLESMNRLLEETKEISEAGWRAILNEERLLQRLDLYESQLSTLQQDLPPDSLQGQLQQVLEQKSFLEKNSEQRLALLLQEKTEALAKATNLESCLTDSENECTRLRQDFEVTQELYRSTKSDYFEKVHELEQMEYQLDKANKKMVMLECQLTHHKSEIDSIKAEANSDKDKLKLPNSTSDEPNPVNSAVNGVNNGPVENTESLAAKVDVTGQLQSSLAHRADVIRGEVALAELCEIDRYCELQERFVTSEASLEQMLDSTSDGISSHLTDSIRQFHQSMELIKSIQDELNVLSQLKSALTLNVKSSSEAPNSLQMLVDKELNCVNSSESTLAHSTENDSKFVEALFRARQLTSRVTACQARAEASLSSYCALQKRQEAPVVCDISGDLPLSKPSSETSNDLDKPDEVSVTREFVVHSTEPAQNDRANTEAPSAPPDGEVNESELMQLRDQLEVALADLELYKNTADNFKQQDAVKGKLLLSVQEECDTLRKRIDHIEADVAVSREDHQRLITEAQRTRTEANELRKERDALNEQVDACNHRIEQLQTSLTKTLIISNSKPDNVSPHPLSNSTSDSGGDLIQPSLSGASYSAHPVDERRGVQHTLSSLAPNQGSMFSLLVIIPVMVLLCAIMVYIFSKFAS